MKIELDDMSEVYEFADLVNDAKAWRAKQTERDQEADYARAEWNYHNLKSDWTDAEIIAGKRNPEVPEVAASVEVAVQGTSEALQAGTVDQTGPSLPDDTDAPTYDADGRRWDERRDSSNKGLNKDGTWRTRRNHGLSDEQFERIKAEGIAAGKAEREAADPIESAQPEQADETPAVTETHPLPTEVEETPDAETRDYTDLIENAKLIAGDQKDGLLDVLNVAKEFVKAHSPMAWTEFSQAVVPGKSVQGYEPAERRLILAAIEVYNAENAS